MTTALFSTLLVWLKSFYYNHIQKAMALLLGAMTVVDLTGYHDSIAAFTGEKGYHALRLAGAAVIVARAMQAKK